MNQQPYIPLLLGMIIAVMLHLAAAPLVRYGFVPDENDLPRPLAKLSLTDLIAPDLVRFDQPFTLELTVTNLGQAPATPPWNDSIYLSDDAVLSHEDQRLTTLVHNTALDPNASYSERVNLPALGENAVGLKHLIITNDFQPHTDPGRYPGQRDSASSTATKPTTSRVLPIWIDNGKPVQLELTQTTSPPTALAGGAIQPAWTVENISEGLAYQPWTDILALSADDTFSGDDIVLGQFARPRPLLPGQTYTQSPQLVAIPRNLEGQFHLFFITDPARQTSADPISPNSPRVRSLPITIEQLKLPDLAVLHIDVPGSVVRGEPTAFGYVVQNLGNVTAAGSWLDGIYLSSDAKLDPSDPPVTLAPAPPDLKPGYRYIEDQLVFTVPKDMPLPVYLIVKADADDTLDQGPFTDNNTLAVELNVVDQAPESKLGKIEPPFETTVAWISYDDFKELEARKAEYIQPAVQELADPVELAKFTLDPTPPAATANPDPQPEPAEQTEPKKPSESQVEGPEPADAAATTAETQRRDELMRAAQAPRNQIESDLGPGRPLDAAPSDRVTEGPIAAPIAGPSPDIPQNPDPNPTDTQGESPEPSPTASKTPAERPAESDGDTVEDQQTPAKADAAEAAEQQEQTPPSQAREGDSPTSAPRQERESPPVTRIEDTIVVRPGRVLTAEGIEIDTFAPRPSTITLYSTIPRNPEAILIFDKTGSVIDVTLKHSAGSPGWDGPIVTSLYRWRAKGPLIDNLDGTLSVPVRLILAGE